MRGIGAGAFFLWLVTVNQPGSDAQSRAAVDLELVLAADTSVSMDSEERRIQTNSYARAFHDPAVQAAIVSGPRSRIAATYIEWSGSETQRIVVPWTLIDGHESADKFADQISHSVAQSDFSATAIGAAIRFAADLIDRNGYEGDRKVIDISGDGYSNDGIDPKTARATAVNAGVTINGLPLAIRAEAKSSVSGSLDGYYRSAVIGGPDAFAIVVRDIEDLERSLRQKLIREIAFRSTARAVR